MNGSDVLIEQNRCPFPHGRWQARLRELSDQYQSNHPYPHIHLKDFLDSDVARQLTRQFPNPEDAAWVQYKHYHENKLGITRRDLNSDFHS